MGEKKSQTCNHLIAETSFLTITTYNYAMGSQVP